MYFFFGERYGVLVRDSNMLSKENYTRGFG